MQCQICKNNQATIHLTEIVEGARTEMHLCESCAQQEGFTVKSQIPINELLANLLATQPEEQNLFADSENELACPACGFTLGQFAQKAVLGCPDDYHVFEKSLLPLIQKAHNGKTVHCGKIPSKVPIDDRKKIKLTTLQQELESAVKTENYELAAEIRDKINQYS